MTMMRLIPHLPLIPFKTALRLLRDYGMSQSVLSQLVGVSRVQVIRWYAADVKPTPLSEEAVSVLAYRVLAARKHGRLNRAPRGYKAWVKALNTDVPPVYTFQAEDLLTPETAHATA